MLITDRAGVLKAWTAQRDLFDEDFSRGALIGRALEGQTTAGLWIEPGPAGDELYQAVAVPVATSGHRDPAWRRGSGPEDRQRAGGAAPPAHQLRDRFLFPRHPRRAPAGGVYPQRGCRRRRQSAGSR